MRTLIEMRTFSNANAATFADANTKEAELSSQDQDQGS
jgi:hypothetical protein